MNINLKIFPHLNIVSAMVPVLLIAVGLTFFLVSCNLFNGGVSEETQDTGAQVTSSEESGSETDMNLLNEIEVWDRVDPKEQIELTGSIEKFMETNPGIKVNSRHFRSEEELIDQFKAASLAGAGADILVASLESAAILAESGVIKPVPSDLIYNDLLGGLAEISKFEGEAYAVPFRATEFLVLYFNKEFTDKAPSNFEELMEYAKQVNNPVEDSWGFLFNLTEPDWIIPFIGGFQDWIYDYDTGSISLDSDAMVKTLDFLIKIYNEEKILPYNFEYEEINNAFKSGKAHMIINGNWAIDEYRQEGLDFGIAKIPRVPGGYKNPTPMVDGFGFMFNTNSYGDEYEAGKKLISYLMSEEIQILWTQKTQTLPAITSVEDSSFLQESQVLSTEMQQVEICRGKPPENILRVIRDAVRLNIENVMLGIISTQDAAIKMQEDAVKLLSGSITVEEISSELQTTSSSD